MTPALLMAIVSGLSGAPDVIVELLPPQVAGKDVTFSVKLYNPTGEATGAFALDIWYHSDGEPAGAAPTHTFQVDSLPGAGGWTGQFTYGPSPNGSFKAWAWADKAGVIGDAEPSNNLAGPIPYAVPGGGAALPDLSVAAFTWQQGPDELVYGVAVTNNGAAPAQNVEVDLFYDLAGAPDCWGGDYGGDGHDQALIAELGAGETTNLTFTWTFPPAGDHNSWLSIDCLSLVGESDESNNVAGPLVVTHKEGAKGVDLVVGGFSVSAAKCGAAEYAIEVLNAGDADAPAFSVDLYYDQDDEPSGPGDATLDVEGLKAGTSITLTHLRTGVPDSTHQSWVFVDSAQEVSESCFPIPGPNVGELNNTAEVTTDLSGEVCDCPMKVALVESCDCGGNIVEDGFCCDGGWIAAGCDPEPEPEPEPEPDPEPPAGTDGGSGQPGDGGTGSGDDTQFGSAPGSWEDRVTPDHIQPGPAPPNSKIEAETACGIGAGGRPAMPAVLVLVLAAILALTLGSRWRQARL